MRSLLLSMPAVLLLLGLIACNNTAKKEDTSSRQFVKQEEKIPPVGNTVEREGMLADSTAVRNNDQQPDPTSGTGTHHRNLTPGSLPANPDWDKKIVRTANMTLEVKNYKPFNDAFRNTVRQFGGYVTQEAQTQSGYKIENIVTIKVPVDQFDNTMGRLASDSDKLIEKKISSEDVTMEVVDTKSRMESKQEVRRRYLDLLKQARNMDEILKIQNEINDIQEQIEAASGRIAYLHHSAAFSTINLSYYQVLDASAKNDPEPSFFHKLKDAFSDGWNWFGSLVIGLISIWPLWLAGGLAWVGYRKWRASSKTKSAAS